MGILIGTDFCEGLKGVGAKTALKLAHNGKLEEKLAEDNLCITVKKGNTYILEALNAAVKEFVSSGESDQLKTKWGL